MRFVFTILNKVLRLLVVLGEVDQAESLHELVDIDAPILVKVDALRQVRHGLVADFHLKVRAQEFPGLMKLLKRDQTCQTESRLVNVCRHNRYNK